jgi:predicted nucleic acid-binding protein
VTVVLDASAALAWLFGRDDKTERKRADAMLDALGEAGGLVPALWHSEICNALVVAERRKVASEAQSVDFLTRLGALPIETDSAPMPARRDIVLQLARRFTLSVYDAVYLELALRSDARLASFDRQLVAAMRKAGGRVFE